MSTGVIIALIVIVAAVVLVAAALMLLRARRPHAGGNLKRRFGPEYDRTVARHDGDVKAAERELTERVQRHGALRERPLEPAERERYEARWAAAQERFVDAPREAVAEADRLLAEVAGARGFPDGGQYEEQLAALSVHHAGHVDGYRRVHRVARLGAGADGGAPGTEEMREAMLEARALFEDLLKASAQDTGRHRADRDEVRQTRDREAVPGRRGHLPWGLTHRHAKGS
ncbi:MULTISPECIES: hypothetical protein [Streptomyces]|uniref:Secreted protein n=2 Tax=Streptomyces TaxID=1883 RepID=A0A2U9P1B9_STRAS|nr:hypothetical protein [Streptomyces actuosus]AWT42998.1 hypothetical protein DMT42_12135 [Streptomyces actuosus]MBM4824869.1 hypothetical protein [Streptomyces actuosus]